MAVIGTSIPYLSFPPPSPAPAVPTDCSELRQLQPLTSIQTSTTPIIRQTRIIPISIDRFLLFACSVGPRSCCLPTDLPLVVLAFPPTRHTLAKNTTCRSFAERTKRTPLLALSPSPRLQASILTPCETPPGFTYLARPTFNQTDRNLTPAAISAQCARPSTRPKIQQHRGNYRRHITRVRVLQENHSKSRDPAPPLGRPNVFAPKNACVLKIFGRCGRTRENRRFNCQSTSTAQHLLLDSGSGRLFDHFLLPDSDYYSTVLLG